MVTQPVKEYARMNLYFINGATYQAKHWNGAVDDFAFFKADALDWPSNGGEITITVENEAGESREYVISATPRVVFDCDWRRVTRDAG